MFLKSEVLINDDSMIYFILVCFQNFNTITITQKIQLRKQAEENRDADMFVKKIIKK